MAGPGRNEGFHVLDDFVCEAIHTPSIPRADPAKQGVNEGMSVVEELVIDAGEAAAENSGRPKALSVTLKSLVEPLASLISTSIDPVGTLAVVQKLLADEVNNLQQKS